MVCDAGLSVSESPRLDFVMPRKPQVALVKGNLRQWYRISLGFRVVLATTHRYLIL